MAINVQCPKCGAQFRRPDGLLGKAERCPECRTVFRVADKASQPMKKAPAASPGKPSAAAKRPAPTPSPTAPKVAPKPVEAAAPIAAEKAPPALVRGPAPTNKTRLKKPVAKKPAKPLAKMPNAQAATASEPPALQKGPAKPAATKPAAGKKASKKVSAEAKPVRPELLAANVICAGKKETAAEFDLIKHGLTQANARELVDYMTAAYDKRNEKRSQKKTTMWVSILGGLALVVTCVPGVFSPIAEKSQSLQMTLIAFAAIGAILFLLALRRFIAGPRPIRPEELAAEWRRENDE
jgi:uncharacterized C2H2 Zn-finger protein